MAFWHEIEKQPDRFPDPNFVPGNDYDVTLSWEMCWGGILKGVFAESLFFF